MKKFLLTVLAVIVGGIILSILPLFFMVVIASALSSSKESPVKDNSVLTYNLETDVVDRGADNPMLLLSRRLSGSDGASINLMTLLDNIDKAEVDNRIKGIVLEGSSANIPLAHIREVRNHLQEFKKSGKFIYYHSTSIEQSALYVASLADKIYVAPEGMVPVYGVVSQQIFYKDLLDKLNVDAQIIRHGKFKSAVEPYFLNTMSEESRIQTQRYVDEIWNTMSNDIAESRGIEKEKVDMYANAYDFAYTKYAVDAGLIDGVKYYDEYLSELRGTLGVGEKDEINTVSITTYSNVSVYRPEKQFAKRKIALVTASGQIYDGYNDGDVENIYGESFSRAIRKARQDSTIEAIVLRVHSPGGSASAADIIWREVKLASEVKPVVVSMGQYAASGGYYISCAANYIYAQPSTLTGSIGVFGVLPCAKKLMNNLGVHTQTVSSNNETPVSYLEPLTPTQSKFMHNMVEHVYTSFVNRCAEGRRCSAEHIDSIGQGRVWAGADALKIGLVDELGSIDDAIAKAKALASIDEEVNIVNFPEEEDPFKMMMKQMGVDVKGFVAKSILGDTYSMIETVKAQFGEKPHVEARIEEFVTIK